MLYRVKMVRLTGKYGKPIDTPVLPGELGI